MFFMKTGRGQGKKGKEKRTHVNEYAKFSKADKIRQQREGRNSEHSAEGVRSGGHLAYQKEFFSRPERDYEQAEFYRRPYCSEHIGI